MTEKYEEGNCFICENFFRTLHWHHTVPQALGGKDSLQIPLCGSCHTILHAQSLAIVAYRNGGSNKPKQFWANEVQESNAQQYLEILVASILRSETVVSTDKVYKLPVSLPISWHKLLKLYRTDNNLGSLPNAILHCIKYTLQQKGYCTDDNHHNSKKNCSNNATRAKGVLW